MKILKAVGFSILMGSIIPGAFGSEGRPTFETDELRQLFENVTFNQSDVTVRLIEKIESDRDLEVHFNNVEQLQETLDNPIHISARGNVWFIKDGDSNSPIWYDPAPCVDSHSCIYIKGRPGLELRGTLESDKELVFSSKKFKKDHLNYNGKNLTTLGQKKERKQLIKILSTFDPHLFQVRTDDATSLRAIIRDRDNQDATKKRDLRDLCPDLIMCANEQIRLVATDVISSTKPIALIAPAMDELKTFKKELKLSKYIRFIWPEVSAGVYSIPPLYLVDTHKIICEGDLIMTGEINLPKSNIHIKSRKNLWLAGLTLIGDTLRVVSGGRLYVGSAKGLTQIPRDLYFNYLRALEGHG
jgi:hypothetical protein